MTVTAGEEKLGEIKIQLWEDAAPMHVANFDSLVTIGFYDGTSFHRVIPGFVIQGGDPNTKNFPDQPEKWGIGDPSQTSVPAEFSKLPHVRGTISAARSNDPNSATSQFFICLDRIKSLDRKYTVYGEVLEGMETVDKVLEEPRTFSPHNPRTASLPKERVEMKIVKIEE